MNYKMTEGPRLDLYSFAGVDRTVRVRKTLYLGKEPCALICDYDRDLFFDINIRLKPDMGIWYHAGPPETMVIKQDACRLEKV